MAWGADCLRVSGHGPDTFFRGRSGKVWAVELKMYIGACGYGSHPFYCDAWLAYTGGLGILQWQREREDLLQPVFVWDEIERAAKEFFRGALGNRL